MSKYNRHQSVITTNSESANEDHWLKQFENQLKTAVQPRSTDSSLFDQINSIMNGKSKYPSVEAAVEDMRERSGLTAYLKKNSSEELTIKESNEILTKVRKAAQAINNKFDKNSVIVLRKAPQIFSTIQNYIASSKGNLPVPAIIEKIKSIHKNDVSDNADWEDENLMRLISRMNLNEKKNNPQFFENYSNLGTQEEMNDKDIDPSNNDFFSGLNPVKF